MYVMGVMIHVEANITNVREQPTPHVRRILDGTRPAHVIQLMSVQEAEQEQQHGLQALVQQTAETQIREPTLVRAAQTIPVQ